MSKELYHLSVANLGIISLITYICLALSKNPEMKQKIKEEIIKVLGKV